MLPPLVSGAVSAIHQLVVAWGIPVGYIICCIIQSRLSSRSAIPVPDDLAPAPRVPDLDLTLLAALRCHEEFKARSATDAVQAALARIVLLISRGNLSFTRLTREHEERRAAEAEDASEAGPFVTSDRARKSRRQKDHGRKPVDQDLHEYGSRLLLSVRAHALADIDRRAIDLVMPPGSTSATVEELYLFARGGQDHQAHYDELSDFLGQYAEDLLRAGLVRRAGAPARMLFSMPVMMLVILSCIAVPVLVNAEGVLAFVAVGLIIAVPIVRAVLVDMGMRLTPEGARILGQAEANIRFAEQVKNGDVGLIRKQSDNDIAAFLATLVALGRSGLAADVSERLVASGRVDLSETTPLAQAVSFCTRRLYRADETVRMCYSPIDLVVKGVEKLVDSLRG